MEDDHEAALSCLAMSAKAFVAGVSSGRTASPAPSSLAQIFLRLLDSGSAISGRVAARRFFEQNFQPYRYRANNGFVTGYFEPEVNASRIQTPEFPYPLYGKPADLVRINTQNRPIGFPDHLEYARQTGNGFVEYYDRPDIEAGALSGQGLELFWLRSEVEGFYIHVQGSARLVLTDQSTVRVSYAGKTGHPYTSIGRVMVERGILTLEEANMKNMRKWLDENPDAARELIRLNRSFIFFREVENTYPELGPIAAAGVQLTPGRSIAIDRNVHAYGLPIWIATEKPLPSSSRPFERLMIAQDTGSAIVGPERGDLFIGSGMEAGSIAGSIRHRAAFAVLWPAGD